MGYRLADSTKRRNYGPYSGRLFDNTDATDIEHIPTIRALARVCQWQGVVCGYPCTPKFLASIPWSV